MKDERKQFLNSVERFLVRFRVLSVAITAWSGYVITKAVTWAMALPDISMEHSALLAAILTPIAAIQKFALDFALDGKIDN